MSRPQSPSDGEKPPSWMGAPGYSPSPEQFPPHAPMPGAPPYPEAPREAAAEPGLRHTRFGRAVSATAVWGVVSLIVVALVLGPSESAAAFLSRLTVTVLVPVLLSGLVTWRIARLKAWTFPVFVLVAAPSFWLLCGLTILLDP